MNNYLAELTDGFQTFDLCVPRVGASIIRRVLDEAIHTGVLRLGYSKATVYQQREFVVDCVCLYCPVFRANLSGHLDCDKTSLKLCTSCSTPLALSAILINN